MSLTEALKVSWLYKDGVKDGVKVGRRRGLQKGMEKGLEKGRLTAKQESLRMAVEKRFPGIGPLPQIDAIRQPEVLDQLLLAVFDAADPEQLRIAVSSAANVAQIPPVREYTRMKY